MKGENDVKRGRTSYKVILVLGVTTFLVFPQRALAADGWYMGMDLGFAKAPGIEVAGTDNDVPTTCDGYFVTGVSECNPSPTAWSNDLDGGTGILAGAALGYRLGDFRVEGEYFYRTTTHDTRSNNSVGDADTQRKEEQEIEIAESGVDDVLSHNFFANLYYDFNTDSRFTPYVGVGVGVAQVSLDYFSRWKRNGDPRFISTFPVKKSAAYQNASPMQKQTMNAANPMNRQLAGTTTIADKKLTDTLFGYQILAGVDYRVSDPVSIGLKFRWADFGEFESERHEWDQLRGHESARAPGGRRVLYKVMTDDIRFWGLSLNVKYAF